MNCATQGCYSSVHPGSNYCMECHKNRPDYAYGLDAELQKKQAAKYDVDREREALWWVETTIGRQLGQDFRGALKDGIALCEVINRIKPGMIRKINHKNMPFVHRENITHYLDACRELGVSETDLFVTQYLFEGQNLGSVVDNLFALSAVSRRHGYNGPAIGQKLADKNVRNFSPQVLAKSKGVMSRQTQGSYGYQPEKEKNTDKIIKDPNALRASATPSRQTLGSYGYQPEKEKNTDKIIKDPNALRASATPSRQTLGSYGYQPEKERNTDKIIKDPNALRASAAPSRQTLGSYGYQPEKERHTDKIIKDPNHIMSRGTAASPVVGGPPPPPVVGGPPPPPAAATAKFCGECGARAHGGKFCPECGMKLF